MSGKYIQLRDVPPLAGSFKAVCSVCGSVVYSYGGGSLWCLQCLEPLITKGELFEDEHAGDTLVVITRSAS